MYKKHLIFFTIVLAWFAVLFFMLGFGKDDPDFIMTGSVLSIVIAMCVLGIIILSSGKRKVE
ncbi:MAG TPA: hypothetical protein VI757_09105 [Bacteroidia bacterium]|nr:hypothetical protein [Bacteroidia bacterium]